MTRALAILAACAFLGMWGIAANADDNPNRAHHTSNSPRDPNFNPAEFPNCYVWDMVKKRNVWVCGRSAY